MEWQDQISSAVCGLETATQSRISRLEECMESKLQRATTGLQQVITEAVRAVFRTGDGVKEECRAGLAQVGHVVKLQQDQAAEFARLKQDFAELRSAIASVTVALERDGESVAMRLKQNGTHCELDQTAISPHLLENEVVKLRHDLAAAHEHIESREDATKQAFAEIRRELSAVRTERACAQALSGASEFQSSLQEVSGTRPSKSPGWDAKDQDVQALRRQLDALSAKLESSVATIARLKLEHTQLPNRLERTERKVQELQSQVSDTSSVRGQVKSLVAERHDWLSRSESRQSLLEEGHGYLGKELAMLRLQIGPNGIADFVKRLDGMERRMTELQHGAFSCGSSRDSVSAGFPAVPDMSMLPREVADLRKEVETLALCMTDRPLSHVSWESTSRRLTSQPASVSDSLSGSLERNTIPWNPDFGGTGSALTTGLASFKFGHAHSNDNLQDQLLGRINTIVNRIGLGNATEGPPERSESSRQGAASRAADKTFVKSSSAILPFRAPVGQTPSLLGHVKEGGDAEGSLFLGCPDARDGPPLRVSSWRAADSDRDQGRQSPAPHQGRQSPRSQGTLRPQHSAVSLSPRCGLNSTGSEGSGATLCEGDAQLVLTSVQNSSVGTHKASDSLVARQVGPRTSSMLSPRSGVQSLVGTRAPGESGILQSASRSRLPTTEAQQFTKFSSRGSGIARSGMTSALHRS
eukprot:CAMPEP_0194516912 /NCGR_PEP_ID=MMETSP0253-20130528/49952_1 /TAXON_ID=2966 /ORGANISM="Noctiluca scintillans" /LENGTH=697 /DNA_ID=CAMNT_0039360825 /DNA_START=1 /DNA_END=2091 /DNA_ORIENTATION=+